MDGQTQTPVYDQVAKFWSLLRTGKVWITVDTECAGFGSRGWYDTSCFGDEVAKELVRQKDQKS